MNDARRSPGATGSRAASGSAGCRPSTSRSTSAWSVRRDQAAGRAPGRRPHVRLAVPPRGAAAARLVHPNIVQVFDFGLDERQHQHFIVMEHVAGPVVRRAAARPRAAGRRPGGRRSSPRPAAASTTPTATASSTATSSPATCSSPTPTSSSSPTSGSPAPPTSRASPRSARCSGTAAYLAPEQARGEEAGPRADLYSLGVVAYQLTERAPALRGDVAVGARAQAAARVADAARGPQPAGPAGAGAGGRPGAWQSTRRSAGRRDACSPRRSRTAPAASSRPATRRRTKRLGETAATRVLSGGADGPDPGRAAYRGHRARRTGRARQLEPRRPAYPPRRRTTVPTPGASAPSALRPRAARRFFASWLW